ncbi:MAG: hypothetical protein IJ645_02285 [Ruminococcus sp.]|nr:hypothetical protein [Ruminococcus sp.]
MVKSKLLTPVLAGVLGVSVAGSALGYVLVNRDSDSKSGKKSATDVVSPVEKLTDGFNAATTTEAVENAEKALKGELDFSYDAKATLSFGEGFKKLSGKSDMGSIAVTANANQNGNKASADVAVLYNDNDLVSLNAVIDRDSGNAYVQVPQLSDAYMSVNYEEFISQAQSQLTQSFDFSQLEQLAGSFQFDPAAMTESLSGYAQAIADNFPEGKDGDDVSGDISGYEYSYTTKTYTLTGNDLYNILKAVLEQAKNDQNLSDLYDQITTTAASQGTNLGISYSDFIDKLMEEYGGSVKDTGELFSFDVYFNQDIPAGFKIDQEGFVMDCKTVLTGTVTAVDFNLAYAENGSLTIVGAAEEEDGVTNGSFELKSDIDDDAVEGKLTLTNVGPNGGSIRIDGSADNDGTPVSGWFEIITSVSEDEMSLTVDTGYNGENFVTVSFEGKKTDVKEVTVPTGKIYDITDEASRNEFLDTVDTDKFLENIKSVLGEDLYNEFFNGRSGSYIIEDDDYDYDYDDDYDYGYDLNYDLDDIDLGDLKQITGSTQV